MDDWTVVRVGSWVLFEVVADASTRTPSCSSAVPWHALRLRCIPAP